MMPADIVPHCLLKEYVGHLFSLRASDWAMELENKGGNKSGGGQFI